MTGRFRQIIVLSAAACLMLGPNRTSAQAPASGSDSEQRLKALEAKMDRVLKLLEPRTPALSPLNVSDKHLALIQEARDALLIKCESAQKEYQDFRVHSPLIVLRNSGATVPNFAQLFAKDEAVIHDLQQRQAEVAARTDLVKNVGEVEKEARALLVLLQRRGVDVELLRRTAGTRRDEVVPAVELVRLYGVSLRQEAGELQQLVKAAEERIEQDRKSVREMNIHEVTEESLRRSVDQSQKLLDVIVAQLSKIDVMRQMKP